MQPGVVADQQHALGLLRQALQAIEQAAGAGEVERVLEERLWRGLKRRQNRRRAFRACGARSSTGPAAAAACRPARYSPIGGGGLPATLHQRPLGIAVAAFGLGFGVAQKYIAFSMAYFFLPAAA